MQGRRSPAGPALLVESTLLDKQYSVLVAMSVPSTLVLLAHVRLNESPTCTCSADMLAVAFLNAGMVHTKMVDFVRQLLHKKFSNNYSNKPIVSKNSPKRAKNFDGWIPYKIKKC